MLDKTSHFHFMGIGGIGMSAIAKILKSQGHRVSGCDISKDSKIISELKDIGCIVSNEHNGTVCQNSDINVLVYSTAVQQTNPEIVTARSKEIKIIHRATILAELMNQKKNCIAIGGSHGKTTTSSLISHIFIEAKTDPTIVVGGYLKNINNNAQVGKSEIMIVEADESDKSIEELHPKHAIITNIDLEHLDIYKDIDDIKKTFNKFIDKIPTDGSLILCIDDNNTKSLLPLNNNLKAITYGIEQNADFKAKNIELFNDYSIYDLYKTEEFLAKVKLNIPGKHNILNSLAAIALSLNLNIDLQVILEALKSFKGIERRFSFNGIYNKAEVFEDYGHHPNEIINTLQVARKKAKNKLYVVFQPHRYSRTQKLWDDFIDAFTDYSIDKLIITDIYPASEKAIDNINSLNLVNSIKKKSPNLNINYIELDKNFNSIINSINNSIEPDDLLLILGAGSINKILNELFK